MADFYLDHNAAAGIADHLLALGQGARTARDRGLERARDHRQLIEAARHNWILVTYDFDDFRLLNDAWREWPVEWRLEVTPRHAGILSIPAPDWRRRLWLSDQAASELVRFVNASGTLLNTLHRWRAASGWVRY